jgi:hypothetical protein
MSLTLFLQKSFAAAAPAGWTSSHEVPVLPPDFIATLGFSPRADVLLENALLQKRVWIEFEISRADPAANHLKFAVGHLFSPQSPGDAFVSMVSAHVSTGRANLGASAILLMRKLGMEAFQIPLFPNIRGDEIKHWNHLTQPELHDRKIDIGPELERALTIIEPVFSDRTHRVFFAANAFEVAINVIRWNMDIATESGARLWGNRTVTYFVYDPRSNLFAPSKFCAFVLIDEAATLDPGGVVHVGGGMTIDYYSSIDAHEHRFDGAAAKQHLLDRLGYRLAGPTQNVAFAFRFQRWLATQEHRIRVHPKGPHILIPGQFDI